MTRIPSHPIDIFEANAKSKEWSYTREENDIYFTAAVSGHKGKAISIQVRYIPDEDKLFAIAMYECSTELMKNFDLLEIANDLNHSTFDLTYLWSEHGSCMLVKKGMYFSKIMLTEEYADNVCTEVCSHIGNFLNIIYGDASSSKLSGCALTVSSPVAGNA